jgi:hypothetical protein
MTDEPAAVKATFSDFRLIKGRKQAQLVLEIPIEEADRALAALGGIPQPQSDHWELGFFSPVIAFVRRSNASSVKQHSGSTANAAPVKQ